MSRDEREKYCDPRIRDLGVQLFSYTEDGAYGRYFDGPMNINFRSNFIVLELEELRSKKDLRRRHAFADVPHHPGHVLPSARKRRW